MDTPKITIGDFTVKAMPGQGMTAEELMAQVLFVSGFLRAADAVSEHADAVSEYDELLMSASGEWEVTPEGYRRIEKQEHE